MGFNLELLSPSGWLRSLRKSRRLAVISQRLGPLHGPKARSKAINELFDLVESDPRLRKIMASHNASRDTLLRLYDKLALAGAEQWARGHYVAASSFAFEPCLDYLLSNANASQYGGNFKGVAFCLVEYFRTGNVGALV